jgi:hypothetical protein
MTLANRYVRPKEKKGDHRAVEKRNEKIMLAHMVWSKKLELILCCCSISLVF